MSCCVRAWQQISWHSDAQHSKDEQSSFISWILFGSIIHYDESLRWEHSRRFLPSYFCARWLIEGFYLSKEEAQTAVLLIGIHKEARSQMLHLSRNKRYTLTPEQLKWDKLKLTYKYCFPLLLLLVTTAISLSCTTWEEEKKPLMLVELKALKLRV